jgi:hypothetical protein
MVTDSLGFEEIVIIMGTDSLRVEEIAIISLHRSTKVALVYWAFGHR